MTQCLPAFSFSPTPVDEAKGVTIHRVIGGERLAILDPFMLLDHPTIQAGSDIVGFPRHPHRGIETLSVVISGEVGHKDSMGVEGTVAAGGAQWMTAGNGIFHEEMLIPGPEGAEFLQLWFSLPTALKRIPPAYRGASAEMVPEVQVEGGSVRVVAGAYRGTPGAFQGIAVNPTVLDVKLEASANLEIPVDPQAAAFVYVFRGTALLGEKPSSAPQMTVLTMGEKLIVTAGEEGARFLFVAAVPLNEPIVQYRSFVMNTVEDMRETVEMIESGTFGTHRP